MKLTIEDLKNLKENDWVYIKILDMEDISHLSEEQYVQKLGDDERADYFIFWNYRACDEDSLIYSAYGTKWIAYKNKEEMETEYKIEQGLLLKLPCKLGTPLYNIIKSCDENTPDFEEDCKYYESAFYECDEHCKIKNNYDIDKLNCSMNLDIYCNECKKRLMIEESTFTLSKLNQVYGTAQFDKDIPLEDTYFLSEEEALKHMNKLKRS